MIARKAFLVLFVASLATTLPTGTALADAADLPFAVAVNAADQAFSEAAWATETANDPSTTCNPRARAAYGTSQVHEPNVGAVFAKDAAAWAVHCHSISEPPDDYSLTMTITFQQFNIATLSFSDIPGTVTCSKGSTVGQVAQDCENVKTYTLNHPSLNKVHRAKFCIVSPDPGCFFSEVWFSGQFNVVL